MTKVYISGKISGIEDEAKILFDNAENHLIGLGYEVVNPMTIEHNHDLSWNSYMKTDIKALMDCTHIYLLPNYIDSKGAIIEKQLAENVGINVIFGNKL